MPLTQQPPAGPSWSWAVSGLIALGLGILTITIQYVRGLLRRSREEGVLAENLKNLWEKNAAQDASISTLREELTRSSAECRDGLATARRAAATARDVEEQLRTLASAKSTTHGELHERIGELAVAVAEIRTRCDSMAEMSGGTDTQGRPRRRCAPGGQEP